MLPMFSGLRRASTVFVPPVIIGRFAAKQAPSSVGGMVGDMMINICGGGQGNDPNTGNWNDISLDGIAGYPGCHIFWKIVPPDQVSTAVWGGESSFLVIRGPKTLTKVLAQPLYNSASVNFGPFTRSRKNCGFMTALWAVGSVYDQSNPSLTVPIAAQDTLSASYYYGATNRSLVFAQAVFYLLQEYNGETFTLHKGTPTPEGVAGAVLEMAS